jgi:hypothetical protein
MTDEEIKAVEMEWRKAHPASFAHRELLEGEMCSGPCIPDDFPQLHVERFRERGCHARLTSYQVPKDGGIEQCFVVVNIREQILIESQVVPA